MPSEPAIQPIDPIPMASPSMPGALPTDLPYRKSPSPVDEHRPVYGPEPRPRYYEEQEQQYPPSAVLPAQALPPSINTTFAPPPLDIRVIQTNCQVNLLELISLQGKVAAVGRSRDNEGRLRTQSGLVLDDLQALQVEVKERIKAAENHRWRRWLVGGGVASFIPLVRKIFRRKHDDEESDSTMNNTEYAFKKSKSLLARIKDGLFGGGGLASIAFFVFAVLYVFQNEVTLRVEDDGVKTVPAFAGMTQTQKDDYFRQLYREQPNFKELAKKDAEFAKIEKKGDLDFTDPRVVMQLTKTLLKLDFGLTLDLPPDRLCPTVKNRHNYVMWLKDLMDTTDDGSRSKRVGMDIGTGASCIYPLLGCTERPWSFIGVDIDEESLKWATKNITSNKMQDRITLITSARDKPIIPFEETGLERIDFTMTNPPFYTSEQEMLDSASKKNLPPATACTGAPVEMVTEGGEVGFVERILLQSLKLREKIQWYTAMFGFLSSVSKVVDLLQEHGIDNFAVTEFVQGVKTRRWAIAWSFHDLRPSQAICRGILTDAVQKSVLPAITEAIVTRLSDVVDADSFGHAFQTAISKLELESWEWDKKKMSGTGKARDKVWARAWRRKRKREAEGENQATPAPTNTFGFKVWIERSEGSLVIHSRWLQGHDAVAFESFRGFLKAIAKSARTESNGPESK